MLVYLDTDDMEVYRHPKIKKKHFLAFLKETDKPGKISDTVESLIAQVADAHLSIDLVEFLATKYVEPGVTDENNMASSSSTI